MRSSSLDYTSSTGLVAVVLPASLHIPQDLCRLHLVISELPKKIRWSKAVLAYPDALVVD